MWHPGNGCCVWYPNNGCWPLFTLLLPPVAIYSTCLSVLLSTKWPFKLPATLLPEATYIIGASVASGHLLPVLRLPVVTYTTGATAASGHLLKVLLLPVATYSRCYCCQWSLTTGVSAAHCFNAAIEQYSNWVLRSPRFDRIVPLSESCKCGGGEWEQTQNNSNS